VREKKKRRLIGRPSPAMFVACLALMIALSGTGYAVTALPRNSVGTAQLKNDAVNSAKVKKGSLLGSDFAAGQLPAGEDGPAGPMGPAGSAGPKGETGAQGPAGPAGPKGDTGAAGPQGPAGAGFNWRGAWSCSGSYAARDVVSYNGSTYLAESATGGCVQPPFAPWKLLAEKGATGATGPQGPQGPAGPQGPQGIQGPVGPRGPSNTYWRSANVHSSAPNFTGAAWCDAGDKVAGGGAVPSSAGSTGIFHSKPVSNASGQQGWEVRGYLNFGWASGGLDAVAVCLDTA
jgi:hypothetical protein